MNMIKNTSKTPKAGTKNVFTDMYYDYMAYIMFSFIYTADERVKCFHLKYAIVLLNISSNIPQVSRKT